MIMYVWLKAEGLQVPADEMHGQLRWAEGPTSCMLIVLGLRLVTYLDWSSVGVRVGRAPRMGDEEGE